MLCRSAVLVSTAVVATTFGALPAQAAGGRGTDVRPIPAAGTAVTEDYAGLSSSGTGQTALPVGVRFFEDGTGSAAEGNYQAGTGSSTSGDVYSFGSAGSGERAFGSVASGSVAPIFLGEALRNDTGATITSLQVSYTGEQWRAGGGRTTPDTLAFSFAVNPTALNSGSYTAVPALDFASPQVSAPAGALDGNAAPNRAARSATISGLSIPAGATVVLRFTDTNASGSDDGLAVDDLSVTATTGSGGEDPPPPPPPPPSARIHDIQGAAHRSPVEGTSVSDVPGVVTVLRSNGFYFQDPSPDADEETSEAIFVFTGGAPSVTVGDSITVDGTVAEFRPGGTGGTNNLTISQINPASGGITTVDVGVALPGPTIIGSGGRVPPTSVIDDDANGDVESMGSFDAAQDGIDFYESLEAMRVQINDAVAVGPTNNFGELPVLADNGAGATGRTGRGGIEVDADDFNPERVFLDDSLLDPPDVSVGDRVTGAMVGVVDYTFGNFKIQLTQVGGVTPGAAPRENARATAPGEVSVATFNVENLDPGDDQAKFDALADTVVDNLASPDILALEEIQDNNGATNDSIVAADQTYNKLIAAITAAGGPTYEFRQIDPMDDQEGGEPGGNIRVGFLFNDDRGLAFVNRPGGSPSTDATVVNNGGRPELSASPGRFATGNPNFSATRRPLAGEFTFGGETLFVIANHFSSKGGDQPLFGRNQPPVQGSLPKRVEQARAVRAFVDDLLAVDPQAKVAVVGDINDFEFSQTVARLTDGGALIDLPATLPDSDRYTFVFEGNSQVLDHILLTQSANSLRSDYDIVHVNSDYVDQISDHEPQLTRLVLGDDPEEPTPDPVIPEAPAAALLPLLAVGLGAAALIVRRRVVTI